MILNKVILNLGLWFYINGARNSCKRKRNFLKVIFRNSQWKPFTLFFPFLEIANILAVKQYLILTPGSAILGTPLHNGVQKMPFPERLSGTFLGWPWTGEVKNYSIHRSGGLKSKLYSCSWSCLTKSMWVEHYGQTSSFEAVPDLCWKQPFSGIKQNYWRALNSLIYTNNSKKILWNTKKYWARWGALFGVLCHFQSDEEYVGSQEWMAVQGSMWVSVRFKMLKKPVFRQKGKKKFLAKISLFAQGPLGITALEGKKGFLCPIDNTVRQYWDAEQKEIKW